MDYEGRNVEFVRRVKSAQMSCHVSPDQAVGTDDGVRIYAAAVVDAPFRNVGRSALIVSASVVGMACGKPL